MDINNDESLPTPGNSRDYCDEFSNDSSNHLRKNSALAHTYIDKYMNQSMKPYQRGGYDSAMMASA